jgi:hypothetical protein
LFPIKIHSFLSFTAISANSSHEAGGWFGVRLRVGILNSLVLSLSTMVRGIRVSLREANQSFSASRRIAARLQLTARLLKRILNPIGRRTLWCILVGVSCR